MQENIYYYILLLIFHPIIGKHPAVKEQQRCVDVHAGNHNNDYFLFKMLPNASKDFVIFLPNFSPLLSTAGLWKHPAGKEQYR